MIAARTRLFAFTVTPAAFKNSVCYREKWGTLCGRWLIHLPTRARAAAPCHAKRACLSGKTALTTLQKGGVVAFCTFSVKLACTQLPKSNVSGRDRGGGGAGGERLPALCTLGSAYLTPEYAVATVILFQRLPPTAHRQFHHETKRGRCTRSNLVFPQTDGRDSISCFFGRRLPPRPPVGNDIRFRPILLLYCTNMMGPGCAVPASPIIAMKGRVHRDDYWL